MVIAHVISEIVAVYKRKSMEQIFLETVTTDGDCLLQGYRHLRPFGIMSGYVLRVTALGA
jgi:hypothetical protein